ncbi:MAG TPA: MgtC/SapB family protein [Terracidiphilus sp.]|nr:MgtC/SapB family protein [Terracidiphilus sp.]
MPTVITWQEIALRLILTVLAGGLLGMERSRTGHFAGLRTTLLVALAASVSMIQMNLLIPTNGKPHDSYAVMDLMRLPLGILTGVGFIGAGAIIRKKNEMIVGVTTAATMWFATIVGLCLGGGQKILGVVAAVLGFLVLWGLRRFENRIENYQTAALSLTIAEDRMTAERLREQLVKAKFHVKSLSVAHRVSEHHKKFDCDVRWPSSEGGPAVPKLLAELEQLPGIIELTWKAISSAPS